MKRSKKIYRLHGLLLPLSAALAAAVLMMRSELVLPSVRGALLLCYQAVVPSLFPFFVLADIIVCSGAADSLAHRLRPVMYPLFRVGGAGALALIIGLISGYPMGANVIGTLYQNGKITQGEAERLLPFCNNSGPLFVIGAVGTAMLGSARVGLFLYAVHAASALCVGLCFRAVPGKPRPRSAHVGAAPAAKASNGLTLISTSVTAAVRSILTVCGYVVFFAAVTACIAPMADCLPPQLALLLKGMLEVTNGVYLLTQSAQTGRVMLTAISFCVGFGGVCVLLQAAGMLAGSGLSMRSYVAGKLLHGAIAAAATYWLYPFFAQQIAGAFAPCAAAAFTTARQARIGSGMTAFWVAVTMIFLYITFKKRRKAFYYLAKFNKK